MSHASYPAKTYFNLSGVSFADIFEGKQHVWDAINGLDDYIAAQFETGRIKANHGSSGNIFVGEGTTIEEGVLINGPAIIGRNCTIRHAAYLRNGCLIGDNVVIGHGCEVKHSILMNNVAVAHLNVVLDSIFGNNANFSGGAITANYRLDKQPVKVKHGGEKIETGLSKFGAVLGDGVNVGVNTVLNPGTVLGKNTVVYPQRLVTGAHPENSVIK